MNTEVYHEYSNLSVYTIDAESLLALKLASARKESWDMSDRAVPNRVFQTPTRTGTVSVQVPPKPLLPSVLERRL